MWYAGAYTGQIPLIRSSCNLSRFARPSRQTGELQSLRGPAFTLGIVHPVATKQPSL